MAPQVSICMVDFKVPLTPGYTGSVSSQKVTFYYKFIIYFRKLEILRSTLLMANAYNLLIQLLRIMLDRLDINALWMCSSWIRFPWHQRIVIFSFTDLKLSRDLKSNLRPCSHCPQMRSWSSSWKNRISCGVCCSHYLKSNLHQSQYNKNQIWGCSINKP